MKEPKTSLFNKVLNAVLPTRGKILIVDDAFENNAALAARNIKGVSLTEAGKKFQHYAKQQVEQWQIFKQSLDETQQALTGKLSIYCSVTAAYSHFPPLLERFRLQHPLVEIMLTTGDAADARAS